MTWCDRLKTNKFPPDGLAEWGLKTSFYKLTTTNGQTDKKKTLYKGHKLPHYLYTVSYIFESLIFHFVNLDLLRTLLWSLFDDWNMLTWHFLLWSGADQSLLHTPTRRKHGQSCCWGSSTFLERHQKYINRQNLLTIYAISLQYSTPAVILILCVLCLCDHF